MDSDIGKNIDRISKLPDCLLCHILSFLPTKYAVGTSILSTRWQYLWTSVPNLDFDDRELFQKDARWDGHGKNHHELSFQNFVSRVLFLSDAPCFQKFHLKIASLGTMDLLDAWISAWISAAIKRSVQDLEFHNQPSDDISYVRLPHTLFTSNTLAVLTLFGAFLHIPGSVWLPSLKVLNLESVEYITVDSLQKLFSGCPVLEELNLKLWIVDGLARYRVLKIFVPTLRRLKVHFDLGDEDNSEDKFYRPRCKLVVDGPQLEHLDLTNFVSEKFLFKNLSSMSKASFLVQSHHFIDNGLHIYKLLSAIPNVKFLDAFLSFQTDVNDYMLPTFHNLTQLKFGADGFCGWNLKLLADFLQCSPNLEVLILEGSKHHNSAKSWNRPQEVPSCLLSRLKKIVFERFTGKGYELDMIEYFLKNAKVLKEMTVDCKNSNDCFWRILAAFPRGSKTSRVNLLV